MSPERLAEFAGRWRLQRRIESVRKGGSGLFDGRAVFTATDNGAGPALAYEEAGELRLPGQGGFEATRRYLWCAVAGGVDVCFADGSDFHHFALGQPVVTAWHDCLPDLYEVSYNFTHWPDWRVIWRVRGPRKDYTMITDYRR